MKGYTGVAAVMIAAACGGGSSPTDTTKQPVSTSYAVSILADSTTVDPAIGQRCHVIRLAAKTTPTLAGGSFDWSSENESIATVSSIGEVVLQRPGETRVRAVLKQDPTAQATQRIRVDAVDQPFFGEFSVAVNGASRNVDNSTIAAGEYQRLFTYGVSPAYANGKVETYIDNSLSYRDDVELAAADHCATVVLGFRWRAGTVPYQAGAHTFSARLFDSTGKEVSEIVSNFAIK